MNGDVQFESSYPSQQVFDFVEISMRTQNLREHGAFTVRRAVRVVNERTKARISRCVSVGHFWYLIFVETLLSLSRINSKARGQI
jgi:hypothetical protein